MAALLTAETGNTERVVKYIAECREMGITIEPPDINSSECNFTPAGEGIRFGLGAVRNVGFNTVQAVQAARERLGRFTSLYQFCEEVDTRVLNRRVLESLVKAGAFDSLGAQRAALLEVVDKVLERGARLQRDRVSAQHALFGSAGEAPAPPPALPEVDEWPEHERLRFEKEILGFYITGHPLARYEGRLKAASVLPIAELENSQSNDSVRLAGIVVRVRAMRSKKGERWAIATLEDLSGVIDLLVFPEAFRRLEPRLYPDAVLLVKGRARVEESGVRVAVQEADPLEQALPAPAGRLLIDLDVSRLNPQTIERLEALFRRKPGRCRVEFKLPPEFGEHTGGKDVRIQVDDELLSELRGLCGESAVHVER